MANSPAIHILGKTSRLLLRAPEEKDMDRILALWTDPVVTRYVGGPRAPDIVADFRQYAADPGHFIQHEAEWWWSIVELASGQFAGMCGLIAKQIDGLDELEIVYFLLPACWGRGYATEAGRLVVDYAFTELKRDTLVAIVDPGNTASIAVARRLGIQFDRSLARPQGITRHIYRLNRQD